MKKTVAIISIAKNQVNLSQKRLSVMEHLTAEITQMSVAKFAQGDLRG